MNAISRRHFINLSIVAGAAVQFAPSSVYSTASVNEKREVGIYADLEKNDYDITFRHLSGLGFKSLELYSGNFDMSMEKPLKTAMAKYKMEVLSLFTLGPGLTTWDFYEGQKTIGLVCREYRQARIDAMKRMSDLAGSCGIKMVETHVGYIPENPGDPNYGETVSALKNIVSHCKANGQIFLYHAGQESPTTMLRTILDVGYDNQGVGMDTANLIMYDRGHPVNALEVYGKYVKLVNAKDALYPTDTRNLGKEVQIGEGRVDFPTLIKKLKAIGYTGPVIIENELSQGKKWESEVLKSQKFIQGLLNS